MLPRIRHRNNTTALRYCFAAQKILFVTKASPVPHSGLIKETAPELPIVFARVRIIGTFELSYLIRKVSSRMNITSIQLRWMLTSIDLKWH